MISRKLERLAVGVLDGRASRRDFLQYAARAGVSASAAYAFLQTVGGARPARATSHVSGEITMIKGPHAAKEAEFEAMIIDDFNRDVAPDVTVDFTTYDWGNMNTELTTAFAGGSPPDVLYLVDLVYPFFAERGLLHDMSSLIDDPDWASERDAIEPFAWGLASQGDGVWGVPVLGAIYNIFLNLDLLDAAGVTDSWQRSYGDMLAAAEATTSGDVHGFSMRTRVADFAFWDWFPYMHNAAADILAGDWGSCGLANADAEAAMDFLIEIHKAGVTPTVGSFDWQGQTDLFKAGKIAIHHNETPLIPVLDANPPGFRWDVAAAPPGPAGQTLMGNFGILCIAEASQNKEAAWEFIKHWASGPQVGRFADQVNLQVVRSDIVGDLFQGNPAMQKVQTEFVPAVQGVQPHPKILQIIQTLWPVAENAYRGNLSGQQAIAEMCQAVESVLEA
jgi:ABC-type glycerol-3-phosphate transport system substrate-binding protein